jgi:hypothetical protein
MSLEHSRFSLRFPFKRQDRSLTVHEKPENQRTHPGICIQITAPPMRILQAIQRDTNFLASHGVPSPRLEAELLLAAVLRIPRLELYLNSGRELQQDEMETLNRMVARRARREPSQYITGTASFCGFELAVNSTVLVPRPETELLAERGWKFLNQRRQEDENPHPNPLPRPRSIFALAAVVWPLLSPSMLRIRKFTPPIFRPKP